MRVFQWVPGGGCSHWPVPGSQLLSVPFQGPAAVPRAGGALGCHVMLVERRVLQSCSPKRLAPVGRAGRSSAARGAGRLLPDAIPMGWPVATLCHLWVPWKHLECVRLGQATPVGCFWGAAVAGASPPCGARPLHRVCASPARGRQGRVACPLNGLQQRQVLGKAKRDGSRCCKGSSSARTNPAPLHPG